MRPFMQRDFLINSLKTKTKYNMTTIRKKIKQQSAAELVDMFKSEIQMNMPMFVIEEMVFSNATKRKNGKKKDISDKVVKEGHRSVRSKRRMTKEEEKEENVDFKQEPCCIILNDKDSNKEALNNEVGMLAVADAVVPNKSINKHTGTENTASSSVNAQNKRRGAKVKITPKKARDSVITLDDCEVSSKLKPYKSSKTNFIK